ncbi:hypothetical protein ACP4OV_008648 [Aristida adscensionis]
MFDSESHHRLWPDLLVTSVKALYQRRLDLLTLGWIDGHGGSLPASSPASGCSDQIGLDGMYKKSLSPLLYPHFARTLHREQC